MNRHAWGASALALALALLPGISRPVDAQPAKGAPAAFDRVREVMANRFRDEKLTGDPDRDFAQLLAATYEELVFLAKTQLEYGGDRDLREMAQSVQDNQQKQIDLLKAFQLRRHQADYRAQPDQPPPGSGPLDVQSKAAPPPTPAASQQVAQTAAPAPKAAATPLVAGTVKKIDPASGKVTLDHERIPNIDMDAMTMAYKVQDPAMLKGLKPGDKVRFSADEVNGQTLITTIRPGR